LKRLAYISPESFIDVDIPVIKELNRHYELIWFVTFVREIEGVTRFFSIDYIVDYCNENNINFVIVENKSRTRNPTRIISAIKDIILPIKQFKPDIIYFESFYDPYLPFVARILLGNRKTIIGIHDVENHSGIGFVHKIIQRLTIKTYRFFHAFSATQKDLLLKKFPDKKVEVARLFLKNYGDNPLPKLGNQSVIFLFFGRILLYKGLDILLRAVNELPSSYRNKFKVIIAGKCNDFEYYNSLIHVKDIYDFRLRFIKTEEVPSLFTEADFLILPYRDVTQSGPLFLAFNYLLPCITSDLPGFNEYIENGINGFTFHNNNVADLAKCLAKIIEMDFESRIKVKSNLSGYVKREFSTEKTLNEYKRVFNQIIANAKISPEIL
jgi:glycosyltransferase involved in cell wall biosynthesis